jgi:hypothetical protein
MSPTRKQSADLKQGKPANRTPTQEELLEEIQRAEDEQNTREQAKRLWAKEKS